MLVIQRVISILHMFVGISFFITLLQLLRFLQQFCYLAIQDACTKRVFLLVLRRWFLYLFLKGNVTASASSGDVRISLMSLYLLMIHSFRNRVPVRYNRLKDDFLTSFEGDFLHSVTFWVSVVWAFFKTKQPSSIACKFCFELYYTYYSTTCLRLVL